MKGSDKFSVEEAADLEAVVLAAGREFASQAIPFHRILREFRMTRAWLYTSQHHKTFWDWAKWAGPKIGLRAQTLVAYAGPHYEDNKSRAETKLAAMPTFVVRGFAAAMLQKAVKKAHGSGIYDRANGYSAAIVHVCEVYLEAASRPKRKTA